MRVCGCGRDVYVQRDSERGWKREGETERRGGGIGRERVCVSVRENRFDIDG